MRRPISSVLLTGALAALLTVGTAGVAAAAPATSTTAGPWAAVAVDPSSGAVGYVWNYGSQDAAAAAARGQCGADGCTSVVEVANGCASLAQASSGRLGWAYGRSRGDAEGIARREAGGGARVLAWACSGAYA